MGRGLRYRGWCPGTSTRTSGTAIAKGRAGHSFSAAAAEGALPAANGVLLVRIKK